MSRYVRNIVLGLLIAAPLVLVPSLAANAAPPANATSAPKAPAPVTPPTHPVTPPKPKPLPNPSLAPKDPNNSVMPPDGVMPIGPGAYQPPPMVDGAQTPYDLLEDRLNALSATVKWMAVSNLIMLAFIVTLFVGLRKTRQRPESEPRPGYKLN